MPAEGACKHQQHVPSSYCRGRVVFGADTEVKAVHTITQGGQQLRWRHTNLHGVWTSSITNEKHSRACCLWPPPLPRPRHRLSKLSLACQEQAVSRAAVCVRTYHRSMSSPARQPRFEKASTHPRRRSVKIRLFVSSPHVAVASRPTCRPPGAVAPSIFLLLLRHAP